LILEEGNNTMFRWELMVWEEVEGAHILCAHIVESHFSTWNIYHPELELSLRLICLSKHRLVRCKNLVDKGSASRAEGHVFKSWHALDALMILPNILVF
jgi:hypothetical protein